jgi:TatA/E family protein of Tat protein translocase
MAFLGSAISLADLLVIFLVALVLFGPKRLPEIARTLGRLINELQRTARDFENQITHLDDNITMNTNKTSGENRSGLPASSPSSLPATIEKKQLASHVDGKTPGNSTEKPTHDGLAG